MVDECDNCYFYRTRTSAGSQWPTPGTVSECHLTNPDLKGVGGQWPQVLATDWCGQYQPLGYTATARYLKGSQTITAVAPVLLLDVAGDAVFTACALQGCQLTNSTNQTVIVEFWNAASGGLLLATVGIPANGSVQDTFVPSIMSYTGQIYVGLLAAASSSIYVSAQGTKVRP